MVGINVSLLNPQQVLPECSSLRFFQSTLIKLFSGHLPLISGDIEFNGQSLVGMSPDRRQALGLSVGLQECSVNNGLSVQDNLTLMQSKPRLNPFDPYFDAFPVLNSRLNQLAGTLSDG